MQRTLLNLTTAMLVLAALLTCALPAEGQGQPLIFSATGDGPREDTDWPLLDDYLALEKNDGRSRFLLHVGDITYGREELPEAYYRRVADLFKTAPLPVIFVPGDNEWNDLADPAKGWKYWDETLNHFERYFSEAPKTVRMPEHTANVAWVTDGVLFIGINLVGGRVHDPEEWRWRHAKDFAWVSANLLEHGDEVRAAVVFAQARPAEKHADFFEPFVKRVAAFGKPVLYLHGDGHTYLVEKRWGASNLTRVQVDQVAKAPPLLITVTDDKNDPFLFDRRLPDDGTQAPGG